MGFSENLGPFLNPCLVEARTHSFAGGEHLCVCSRLDSDCVKASSSRSSQIGFCSNLNLTEPCMRSFVGDVHSRACSR